MRVAGREGVRLCLVDPPWYPISRYPGYIQTVSRPYPLCFYVLGAFLPSLPGWCRDADHKIKTPPVAPAGTLSESLGSKLVPSAPQVRLVKAHCLKPSTSHGARARHLRLPQAAMTSDARPAVGAQHAPHLQRLGAAARRPAAPGEAAERRRDPPIDVD